MYFREFYTNIVSGESAVTTFLIEKGLLKDENICQKCNGPVILTTKRSQGKDRPVWLG